MTEPSSAAKGLRVAVVGAGVLGAMCAWRLAQAGARVTLHEADRPAANASSVAAGMIAPAAECAFEPALHPIASELLIARRAWRGLADGIGVPLWETGAWLAGLAGEADRLRALGFEVAVGEAPHDGALFAPSDAVLSAPRALSALHQASRRAGVDALHGVVAAERPSALVDRLDADVVVLATGAPGRGSGLAPELAHLRPIKGQLLRWAGPAGEARPTLREGDGFYLAVTPDEVVAGASMEPGRDDLEPQPAALSRFRDRAEGLLPELRSLTPTIGVGVRADTPDGLPMVGRSAEPGVILATGARRNGWLIAPLVADLVLALAAERPPPVELAPLARRLNPRRFDVKDGT